MTSTHTGSLLPVVTALASIDVLFEEGLIDNVARVGRYLQEELLKIIEPYRDRIDGGDRGLVQGMLFLITGKISSRIANRHLRSANIPYQAV